MKAVCLILLSVLFCLSGLSGCWTEGSEHSSGSGGSETSLPEEPQDPSGENDPEEDPGEGEGEIAVLYLIINGKSAALTLAGNQAVTTLVERLREGDLTFEADDYGGFEKVGSLGFSLPRSDRSIRTQAGDVMLYQGSQLVLFYGSNSWSYTPIGRIEGLSQAELEDFLSAGQGRVSVTLSLSGK